MYADTKDTELLRLWVFDTEFGKRQRRAGPNPPSHLTHQALEQQMVEVETTNAW
jgi:hypothetical protein